MSEYTQPSKFSKGEETANALSHFIGFLLSVAALVMLYARAITWEHRLPVVIFGITMILLYLSSALTHFLKQGRAKNLFFSLDKIGVYLLIAGTYTPLALITLKGALGWTIFGIEWFGAFTGAVIILRKPVNYEKGVNLFFVFSYAVMGWLILIAAGPMISRLPTTGWVLILVGGIIYSIGIFFYKKGKFKYHHLVWHLLVMAGTLFHFLAIYYYVLP